MIAVTVGQHIKQMTVYVVVIVIAGRKQDTARRRHRNVVLRFRRLWMTVTEKNNITLTVVLMYKREHKTC